MIRHPSETAFSAFVMEQTGSREEAIKLSAKLSAIFLAAEIKFFDIIWFNLAYTLTNLENHRTESKFQESFCFKVMIVRFFNGLYPLLYVG